MRIKVINMARRRDRRMKPGSWGETKQKFSILLTETVSEKIDDICDELKLTRSEVLERLCRSECFNSKTIDSIKPTNLI